MDTVYVVLHVHEIADGAEDTKLIGVYESHAAATEAVSRLRKQPGFKDHPEGFTIDAYELNKDHWTEGFVTVG
jgi:hypothetical protein